jgi:hypothetical protein
MKAVTVLIVPLGEYFEQILRCRNKSQAECLSSVLQSEADESCCFRSDCWWQVSYLSRWSGQGWDRVSMIQ